MPNQLLRISPAQLRVALNYLGLLVPLVGFVSAAIIWHASESASPAVSPDSANPAAPLSASDSRKQSRQIEIYYGKTGVLMERWREGLEGVSHGKPLAELIMAVSSIIGAGCLLLATRLPDDKVEIGRTSK
jgi:hypothetical protein